MNVFYVFVSVFYLTASLIMRKLFSKVFLEPFSKQKYIYILDTFLTMTFIVLASKRMQLIPQEFVNIASSAGYIFWGISWVIIILFLLNFTISKSTPHNEERREFLKKSLAGVGAVGAGSTAYIGREQAFNPLVIKENIKLPDEFSKLKGMSVTQISDLHIGPILRKDFLESIVKEVNELKSDVIVITGDIADGVPDLLESEMESLKELKAKQGVYYILGNHEYYWNALKWVELMKKMGLKVLVDEHDVFEINQTKVCMAGVSDKAAKRASVDHCFDPSVALKNAPIDSYKILLAHRPKVCYQAEGLGVHLQLSGHTHGGQAFPWNIVVSFVQPYLKGLYHHKDFQIYVNRGTGFWGPENRLLNSGEITRLDFV